MCCWFSVFMYLGNGRLRNSSVHALNFPLTGEKCFTNFWNVESTLWKADNGKNTVCLSDFPSLKWFGCCRRSWTFETFINQQNTWKYGLNDRTCLCEKNYSPWSCFTQGNETLFANWQKESWQTFEETSGHVRLEWVNKWPNSMTDIWWWWWWWWWWSWWTC
jgi:hypothetical protein